VEGGEGKAPRVLRIDRLVDHRAQKRPASGLGRTEGKANGVSHCWLLFLGKKTIRPPPQKRAHWAHQGKERRKSCAQHFGRRRSRSRATKRKSCRIIVFAPGRRGRRSRHSQLDGESIRAELVDRGNVGQCLRGRRPRAGR